jgi:hypothetical protein
MVWLVGCRRLLWRRARDSSARCGHSFRLVQAVCSPPVPQFTFQVPALLRRVAPHAEECCGICLISFPIPLWRYVEMFDQGKVQTLLLGVFGLVVIVVGIALAAGAKRAQYSETARVGFNTLVAIVIVAVGLGAISFAAFGQKVLNALGVG